MYEQSETNDIRFDSMTTDRECLAESRMRLTVKRNGNYYKVEDSQVTSVGKMDISCKITAK